MTLCEVHRIHRHCNLCALTVCKRWKMCRYTYQDLNATILRLVLFYSPCRIYWSIITENLLQVLGDFWGWGKLTTSVAFQVKSWRLFSYTGILHCVLQSQKWYTPSYRTLLELVSSEFSPVSICSAKQCAKSVNSVFIHPRPGYIHYSFPFFMLNQLHSFQYFAIFHSSYWP